ncbi:hypothetical protein J4226_00425 [Candidatus Pacearchaeota archaeon]|nr:hypothetical protein [Candidatus Pacearchaeota archaeon]
MRKIGGDRKGLSDVVAYVLLISITISLSVLVYGWLKFYAEGEDVAVCSENVNVIVSSYECSKGAGGNLTVTLKNKGLFNIDGFILRVHDRPDAEFGFYVFDELGLGLKTGESKSFVYRFSDPSLLPYGLTDITLVDVQPYLMDDGKISCESHTSQKVSCS